MGKCAALIEIGWLKKWFVADDPIGIMKQVEEIQDFSCLLMMGRAEEGKKGQEQLNKLVMFLEKYHDESLTMEDIKNLNVHLSIGNISCHEIAETEKEVNTVLARPGK